MPFNANDTSIYRRDVKANGSVLSASDREAILKRYLPTPSSKPSSRSSVVKVDHRPLGRRPRIRPYLKHVLHLTVHLWIQLVFGIYIRLQQAWNAVIQKFLGIRHYHHRTPAYIKKDTQSLSRLPEHLSVLLRYDSASDDGAALEALVDEVAELTAWSAAAGIPLVSIYERTGVLKSYMSAVQELVHQKLVQYFGSGSLTPTLRVYAPNLPPLSPIPSRLSNGHTAADSAHSPHIDLLLLSSVDGRDTLVDLTRTLTEMSQSRKLNPKDITASLINTEINATTTIPSFESPFASRNQSPEKVTVNGTDKNNEDGHVANGTTNGHGHGHANSKIEKTTKEALTSEPDLLIVFAPYVKLDGYPPWQIRLTEIFCVGDSGNDVSGRGREGRTRVEYQAFLRALWKYAGAEMRFGR